MHLFAKNLKLPKITEIRTVETLVKQGAQSHCDILHRRDV